MPDEPKNRAAPEDANRPIDATIGFESVGSSRNGVSKQSQDLAFAVALIQVGNISQRRLAESISNWTTHGHETLAEHLVARKVISASKKQELDKLASRQIAKIMSELTLQDGGTSVTQHERLLVTALDESGKLSKLLGVADSTVLSSDQIESRRIGARYTLLRRLGQGGIGTVWLARDENLRRYVAVKEVTRKKGDSSDLAIAHFRREAEITGQLEHPGIVPVYQYGSDEETGHTFYAMRFLGKRTLQDAIIEYHERRDAGNEDRLLMHRLLTAFVNVCQAVAHAHSRKVIHRDLKPENIAIDSFGQVVLLDWGLAKINDETGMYDVNGQAEPGDLHSVGSTHAGRVLGTPLFMAPEQAAGRLDEVDELTDVYGLGGILYAILTGQAPHQRTIETPEGSGRASELFSKIVAVTVPKATEVNSEVPAELAAVCAKALANKRYLRYSSAKELAEDVERFRAGTPVFAYDAPLNRRIGRWIAKHPTLAQLVLLLAALTFLGIGAIAYTGYRGRLALQSARYESLMEFGRELEVNLHFETQELVQDARFLTDFPLMRAITASQMPETVDGGILTEGESTIDVAATSPDEWLERHGRLMDALLTANPSYLVATTVHFGKETMTELVRSERVSVGLYPRRVPDQQLVAGEELRPPSDDVLFNLRPGQVALTTGDQLAEEVPTKNRSPLVLVAICPVFDETGSFFGINALELDLRGRLEDVFAAVAHKNMDVYVTDGKGHVAAHYVDGRFIRRTGDINVMSVYPELVALYRASEGIKEYGDKKTMHAIRVRLGDEQSQAEFGIVTKIIQESD